jgi:hypothetical protein
MRPMSTLLTMAALMAAAPVFLGCGAEAFVDPSEAGLPADFEGPGVYTVPAAPTASFALSRVSIEQAGGVVSVYYDLPADLVGRTQRVELDGLPDGDGAMQLAGTAGTSTCTVAQALLRCHEALSGVHVDVAAASAGLSPGNPRLAAVQAFATDPIGVLSVTLPSEGSSVSE